MLRGRMALTAKLWKKDICAEVPLSIKMLMASGLTNQEIYVTRSCI